MKKTKKMNSIIGIVLLLILLTGCQMYPKFLDDPEVKRVAIDAFRDGLKDAKAHGNIRNPRFAIKYITHAVEIEMVGVDADVKANVISEQQPITKP